VSSIGDDRAGGSPAVGPASGLAGDILVDGTELARRYQQIEALPRGQYFRPGPSQTGDLVGFAAVADDLPRPWVAGRPDLTACYQTCLRLLFAHRRPPVAGSGLVRPYLDPAFNGNLFAWDTAVMVLFARLLQPWLPAVGSLDNFYARQFADGEICREINGTTGLDVPWWVNVGGDGLYSFFHEAYGFRQLKSRAPGVRIESTWHPDLERRPAAPPWLTLDGLNNPLFAWAELESYRQSGDLDRVERVVPPLMAYFAALDDQLRHRCGLYVTDWASMDNSPRNAYLGFGVDTACQMVLFADNLLELGGILRRAGREAPLDVALLERRRAEVSTVVNDLMWDEDRGFYFDLDRSLRRGPVRTAAAFWSLISAVAPPARAARLVAALRDPSAFARPHPVPCLAADEPGYVAEGGYWRGGVWAPVNAMVVAGLERAGHAELARQIATSHVDWLARVHQTESTVFEYYSPETLGPGANDHRDFVGWSGLGPIGFFMTHVIGLTGDAETRTLTWRLPADRVACGIDHYWFAGQQLSLRAEPGPTGWLVDVEGGAGLTLEVRHPSRTVRRDLGGHQRFGLIADPV